MPAPPCAWALSMREWGLWECSDRSGWHYPCEMDPELDTPSAPAAAANLPVQPSQRGGWICLLPPSHYMEGFRSGVPPTPRPRPFCAGGSRFPQILAGLPPCCLSPSCFTFAQAPPLQEGGAACCRVISRGSPWKPQQWEAQLNPGAGEDGRVSPGILLWEPGLPTALLTPRSFRPLFSAKTSPWSCPSW